MSQKKSPKLKKRGRKPATAAERARWRRPISIKVSAEERAILESAAAALGLTLAGLVRSRCGLPVD